MGRASSDDLAGLAAGASVTGRVLNNANGGGFTGKTWADSGVPWMGAAGGGAITPSAANSKAFINFPGPNVAVQTLVKPGASGRATVTLWALRTTLSGAFYGVGFSVTDSSPVLRIYEGTGISTPTQRQTFTPTSNPVTNGVDWIARLVIQGNVVKGQQISAADGTTVLNEVTWTNGGAMPTGVYAGFINDSLPAGSSLILDNPAFDNLDSTPATATNPAAASTGGTTGTGSITVNKATGRAWALPYLASGAEPSKATIRANGVSVAVTAAGVQNFTFSTLPSGQTLKNAYFYDDGASNESGVVSSIEYTTPSPPAPPAGSTAVYFQDDEVIVTFTSTGGTVSSATASLPAASPANGAVTQAPIAMSFNAAGWPGVWSARFPGVPFGDYAAPVVLASNADYPSVSITGAPAFFVDGPTGEPVAPDASTPATAPGAVWPASLAFLAGAASGTSNALAAGVVLSATVAWLPGAVSGSSAATAPGRVFVAAAAFLPGAAEGTREATAPGAVWTAGADWLPGAAGVSQDGTAPGAAWAASAAWLPGAAIVDAQDVVAPGAEWAVGAAWLPGVALGNLALAPSKARMVAYSRERRVVPYRT